MTLVRWFFSWGWWLALLCAGGFLTWGNIQRGERVNHVTATDQEGAVIDADSPTGYAGGKRWLIVPEHNHRSYQWIAETQQMLARGEWRVRHVDYENAPHGRPVYTASPYRWWLGLIARVDHAISGKPLALSVERAALWADPLLHLALLLGTTIFVAHHFGSLAAALIAVAMATLYPFAGSFLPGVPDDCSLSRALALWSVLPLAAGIARLHETASPAPGRPSALDPAHARRRARRLFVIAGIAGGFGLWISIVQQIWVLGGVALGGLIAAWIAARGARNSADDGSGSTPWRAWAIAGAATSVAGYLAEYFPSRLGMQLEVNHPLYGLAWLGLGELLTQVESWFKTGKKFRNWRRALLFAAAIVAIAALPVAIALTETQPLLTLDRFSRRLTFLPDGVVASSFPAWIHRDGLTGAVAATCLPLLLLLSALWLITRRGEPVGPRAANAIALGPVLVTLVTAFNQLAWWNVLDATLLVLGVAAIAAGSIPLTSARRRIAMGCAALMLLPGAVQLVPLPAKGENFAFTRFEIEALIERSLAHWIADRVDSEEAVILAPPDRTTRWSFHGGLRGLGTANWENPDGLAATIQIAAATTADEAQALLNERGITHIVLPSWDTDLEQFARWRLTKAEDAFIMALDHWLLPPWVRPLPYKLPRNVGFDDQSVAIFQVTDDNNRPAATARLAEYFIESEHIENATRAVQALERYPTDLGALAALAQVEKLRGNTEAYTKALNTLLSSLAAGTDRALAWDRRVSVAVVLAQSEHHEVAREQVRRCLEQVNATRLRSLTTGSLYRLQVLSRAYDLPIEDPNLRELAHKLLPAELRSRL
jgi:hypothetical protein